MTLGLLARKKGMTTLLNDHGQAVAVTVLEAGPCAVLARRSREADGYDALQLGFEAAAHPERLSKAERGHFAKAGLAAMRVVEEFRCTGAETFTVGQILTVGGFAKGDRIDVRGCVKGRGYQGVIKRWGKHGGPGSHGSHFHRTTGSIGQRTWPGRVFKNMKLPGQMGNVFRTIRGLEVVGIDPELHLLFVKGAVPGAKNALIRVMNRSADFATRYHAGQAPTTAVETATTPGEEAVSS
ncbi:MAG: 50S ribosomal protein L3 [Deltaproteobacteria bacterium]|nr:50S ribosomal protein L3 [Deltaproteobacteria bacterium]